MSALRKVVGVSGSTIVKKLATLLHYSVWGLPLLGCVNAQKVFKIIISPTHPTQKNILFRYRTIWCVLGFIYLQFSLTLCVRRIDTFFKWLFLCHKHAKTTYYVVLACLWHKNSHLKKVSILLTHSVQNLIVFFSVLYWDFYQYTVSQENWHFFQMTIFVSQTC